jgi:hypothetical protein
MGIFGDSNDKTSRVAMPAWLIAALIGFLTFGPGPFVLGGLVVLELASLLLPAFSLYWVIAWWWHRPPRLPRCRTPQPVLEPPTEEEQIQQCDKLYEKRRNLIKLSSLPDDAKRQALKEAERTHMWEVAEVLKCIRL